MARAGLTTRRVAEAAADLADAVGFENITVSALARSFGVADASLYSHVRNVRDLRTKVAVLASLELSESISTAVAGRAGKDALNAFANAYRDFALAHPGRYAAAQIQLDAGDFEESGQLRAAQTTYAMLHAYGLQEPDLTDAVRLLRSSFHGFVSLEAAKGFAYSRPVEASWEQSVEALHNMLQHWPSRAA
ncbi:TetR-like C-terminal domain-containing protein [Streptomyces albidus (ex Kaewkla and Franco 2022)]|uniref:TetR-like C-terminal domain-containing protein n=1 Tax=Streptomyces albidus (ex Kaewkla and Franco 2022) TaxID=722709 RepID=UPI0015EFB341|nr:TetR-like C-terminal domain-containing protein [Streptomyces albidus (ex Kaewkla and Franco 2022)]